MVQPMDELHARLREVVGDDWCFTQEHQLRTYESDGLLQYSALPAVAVLPGSAEQVQAVVKACADAGVPWVARGAGSGLSGGALPIKDGVLIVVSRMKRILEIDLDDGRVCVEPGVTNSAVSAAVGPHFFYPPDPSSQIVCSEGTLGVATKVWLRVVPSPETVRTLVAFFDHTREAGEAVSEIVQNGVVPGAIEMMDEKAIEASEISAKAGFPIGRGAALLVELDGAERECEARFEEVTAICERHGPDDVRVARDEA